MAKARPEIVFSAPTFDDYTFLVLALYQGRARRYWWHCGACWETCDPSPCMEDMHEEYADHRMLCPGQVSYGQIGILRPRSPQPAAA
jgi:hypothetical protein